MGILEIVLLVVLLIPIFAIFTDSPLGRAVARRLEGRNAPPPELAQLVGRLETLESELEELTRTVEGLKEENQFFQRLLEDGAGRQLPPPPSP
jgi:hypothetical protein